MRFSTWAHGFTIQGNVSLLVSTDQRNGGGGMGQDLERTTYRSSGMAAI